MKIIVYKRKEDGGLMIVFRRLLRTCETNTELYTEGCITFSYSIFLDPINVFGLTLLIFCLDKSNQLIAVQAKLVSKDTYLFNKMQNIKYFI